MKYEHTNVDIDLEAARGAIERRDQEIMELQTREHEKDKAFNAAIEELERLKI